MYGEAVPCEGDHLAQLSLQEVDSLAAGQSTEGGALPGQRDRFAALGIELEPLGKIEGRAVLLLKVEKAPVNGGNEVLPFRKGAGGENGGTHELRQQSVWIKQDVDSHCFGQNVRGTVPGLRVTCLPGGKISLDGLHPGGKSGVVEAVL